MKRRIACISEHASPLGQGGDADCCRQRVYVTELATQLVKAGYEVDIFTRRESAGQPDVVAYKPGIRIVQVIACPSEVVPKELLLPYVDDFCLGVSAFILQHSLRYDLVHANFFLSGIVAMELKKKFNIPFVITFHSLGLLLKAKQEQDIFPAGRIAIEEQIVKRADAIVAGSPLDKNDLVRLYKADSRKIFIIPYGFNPGEFFPTDKQEALDALQLNPAERIVMHVGAMNRRDGADTAIKSLALLAAEKRMIRLLVVRDGGAVAAAERIRLENLAADLGVLRQVTFMSREENEHLNSFYSAADVFVATPLQGSFGSGPVESMACGTPVIGSDEGSTKFSVLEGKTGFLISPGDPEALADRLELLLNNKALRQQMSRNALRHVNACFTWETIAGHVHNLYEYILLNQSQKREVPKPARIKVLNSTVPLRNMYLRRNIEPKYGS